MNIHAQHILKNAAGFTLVELLVVMGIIGILASLLFANFSSARERARDAKRKEDMAQMKNALRLYYNDFGRYPAQSGSVHGGTWNSIVGCGAAGVTDCYPVPTSFTAGSTVYMNSLPTDPSFDTTANTPNYNYNIGSITAPSNTDHFILRVYLENGSDPGITTSQRQCGVVGAVTAKLYMVCD